MPHLARCEKFTTKEIDHKHNIYLNVPMMDRPNVKAIRKGIAYYITPCSLRAGTRLDTVRLEIQSVNR